MKRIPYPRQLPILSALCLLLASALLIPYSLVRANGGTYLTPTGDVTSLWCEEIPDDGSHFNYALGTNDLDGDGKPDVLINTRIEWQDYKWLLRSGATGEALWEKVINDSALKYLDMGEVGDIDGDGLADIVTYERAGNTFIVSAYRGYDGLLFWSENMTLIDDIRYCCSADFMDGAANEVVVTTVNGTSEQKHVIVKDWQGNHLRDIVYDVAGLSIYALDGRDYNNSGNVDLLVWLEDESGAERIWPIEAYDLDSNIRLWRSEILYPYTDLTVHTGPGDMNNDGTDDIVVIAESSDDDWLDEWSYTLFAYSGDDGQLIWSENVTSYYPRIEYVCGSGGMDYNGNGSDDILVIEETVIKGEPENTVTLVAKDGYNGAHIWEEAITGKNARMNVYMPGDLNGDGQDDILVIATSGLWDEICTVNIIAKNLDGTHIWEENFNGLGAYITTGMSNSGDINGDGKNDVVIVLMEFAESGEGSFDLIPIRGYDGYHFWEQNVTGIDMFIDQPELRDIDGDGKADVLAIFVENNISTRTFRGYDGISLWTAETDADNMLYFTGRERTDLGTEERCQFRYDYAHYPLNCDTNGFNDTLVLTPDNICMLACIPQPEPEPEPEPEEPAFVPANSLTGDSSSPTIYAPTNPRMVITGFTAPQSMVQANDEVIVFANVANRGDLAGNYTATLKINGEIREVKKGALAGNTATPVNFIVSIDEPGQYQLDLNGQTLNLTVMENAATTAINQGRNIILALTIIAALLAIALSVMLFRRRRI